MGKPQLPRKRSASSRIEECFSGTAQGEFATAVEDHRTVYYEALDLVTSCIKTRFYQEDYKIHSACERLLLKTVTGGDFDRKMENIVQFYGSDLSSEKLEILRTNYDGEGQGNIHQVFKYSRNLTPAKRALMGEVIKLVKLLMTIYRQRMLRAKELSAH